MKKTTIFAIAVMLMACAKNNGQTESSVMFSLDNTETKSVHDGITNAINSQLQYGIGITLQNTETKVRHEAYIGEKTNLPIGNYKVTYYYGFGRKNLDGASVFATTTPILTGTTTINVKGGKLTNIHLYWDCFAIVVDKHFASGITANDIALETYTYGNYKIAFIRGYQFKTLHVRTIPTEGNESAECEFYAKGNGAEDAIKAEAGHYYLLTDAVEDDSKRNTPVRFGWSLADMQGNGERDMDDDANRTGKGVAMY